MATKLDDSALDWSKAPIQGGGLTSASVLTRSTGDSISNVVIEQNIPVVETVDWSKSKLGGSAGSVEQEHLDDDPETWMALDSDLASESQLLGTLPAHWGTRRYTSDQGPMPEPADPDDVPVDDDTGTQVSTEEEGPAAPPPPTPTITRGKRIGFDNTHIYQQEDGGVNAMPGDATVYGTATDQFEDFGLLGATLLRSNGRSLLWDSLVGFAADSTGIIAGRPVPEDVDMAVTLKYFVALGAGPTDSENVDRYSALFTAAKSSGIKMAFRAIHASGGAAAVEELLPGLRDPAGQVELAMVMIWDEYHYTEVEDSDGNLVLPEINLPSGVQTERGNTWATVEDLDGTRMYSTSNSKSTSGGSNTHSTCAAPTSAIIWHSWQRRRRKCSPTPPLTRGYRWCR